ncbi:MAG: c-type cytochrome [Nannocystaceae bacterium]
MDSSSDGEGESGPDLVRAKEQYGLYCALCHGAEGQGYAADGANALNHPKFLATASDDLIRRAIVRGRTGTPMSAWSAAWGGPLDEAGIAGLTGLIRSWESEAPIEVDPAAVDGSAGIGQAVYAVHCEGCHGPAGAGALYMSLADPGFLADATDGYLKYAIEGGRTGTPMQAYASSLTVQQIADVVALIRSWARPIDDTAPELPSKDISDALLNPGGPEPAFADSERFISVEQLKLAMDTEASFVIVDARAPSDYVTGHITGSVSVPFYDVAAYLDQLPTEQWIVTYCGCPHAASEAAADALLGAGHTKVRVLYEGLDLWVDQGYPTETGP